MIKQLDSLEKMAVMDIWLKTNLSAHSFIPAQHFIDNYQLVEDHYLSVATTFVYKEDGNVKGFISIYNDSFVGALFVAEEHQGQGIGKKLINHCKNIYPSLTLAVYRENPAAVKFYQHCGFTTIKEQTNEDSGFIEYIMTWENIGQG